MQTLPFAALLLLNIKTPTASLTALLTSGDRNDNIAHAV